MQCKQIYKKSKEKNIQFILINLTEIISANRNCFVYNPEGIHKYESLNHINIHIRSKYISISVKIKFSMSYVNNIQQENVIFTNQTMILIKHIIIF